MKVFEGDAFRFAREELLVLFEVLFGWPGEMALLAQLQVVDLPVQPALRQEFVMPAAPLYR